METPAATEEINMGGYLVSPGLWAASWLGCEPAFLHPLQSPCSLELTVDETFRPFSPEPHEREGRWQPELQELLELPRRFAALSHAEFDNVAWETALREDGGGMPGWGMVRDFQAPYCQLFTRNGQVIAQLIAEKMHGYGGAEGYYDCDVLILRYEASEQPAVWELIRSMLRDFPLQYRPMSSLDVS